MLYKEPKLEKIVENMKALGGIIMPFNFPKVQFSLEDDLAILKEREAVIDGYPIWIHYQKSDYDSHYMETLQIYGKNSPFLPFCLICKLAKRFLGPDHLSLVEIFKDNRKIYVWSLFTDLDNQSISPPYDVEREECNFEGFNYSYMQPSQVNFF